MPYACSKLLFERVDREGIFSVFHETVSCLGDKDFSKTRTARMERVVCPRICKLNRTKYKYRIEKGWKAEERQTRVASIYIYLQQIDIARSNGT